MAGPAESYSDIAPSAFLAGYWRQFGDVPHASDIYEAAVDAWQAEGLPLPSIDYEAKHHGPTMEPRQTVGNILLARVAATQVLDLAAGLSPRGLQQVESDDTMRYVEVDLPTMSRIKVQALRSIGARALNSRHVLIGGSALDPETIDRATASLDRTQKISVLSEGFLHYLNDDERAEFARNVLNVLRRFGEGSRLVTDLPHHPTAREASSAPRFTKAGTDRDVSALAFPDQRAALTFFADHGLVEEDRISYVQSGLIRGLRSIPRLGLDIELVEQQQRAWGMHVFRAAGTK